MIQRIPKLVFLMLAGLLSLFLVGCGDAPSSRKAGIAAPRSLDGLRWPYRTAPPKKSGLEIKPEDHQVILESLLGREPQEVGEAIDLLREWTEGVAEAPELMQIPLEGCCPGGGCAALKGTRDRIYEIALLATLTDDDQLRHLATHGLFRFAEALPKWPLYDRQGKPHAQDEAKYLRRWDANGLWNRWHPLDLAESLPLLRAYDLLRPSLTIDERNILEEKLFLYHKNVLDRFTGLMPLYHNLAGYHLIPLIRYGQVLERPEIIHEVVRYWEEMLRYSYTPDGFFREVTPDYHQQITRRMIDDIPDLLKGYSDPVGYLDPVDQSRFDHLDLAAQEQERIAPIRRALDVLALPNGRCAALNDATGGKQAASSDVKGDAPGVLGVAGMAKLGGSGMAALIKFGGTRGHDHDDALNLIWYAAGREIMSDTGYRPLPGSDSSRAWHTVTASHNSVAVDGKTQFQNKALTEVPLPASAVTSSAPPSPSMPARLEAALPAAARFSNQGRLLLYDTSSTAAQMMEAEQENAYPGVTSLFRRTVVMVPTDHGKGFLIDIFRVRGGSRHDYFLRGGLDEPYRFEIDLPFNDASGTEYNFIKLRSSAFIERPFVASVVYPDGVRMDSHVAGLFGEASAKQKLLIGDAPAIRRLGSAPFGIIQRASAPGVPLESCFVFVHEAVEGEKKIQKVEAIHEGMDVRVIVTTDRGRFIVFSGLTARSRFELDDWTFTGKLACVGVDRGQAWGHVSSGSAVMKEGHEIASGREPLPAALVSTSRKEAGDEAHSLLIIPGRSARKDAWRIAHIDLGDTIRYSVPIESVKQEAAGQLRVTLLHSPGFTLSQDGTAVMTQFPGWRVPGGVNVYLE